MKKVELNSTNLHELKDARIISLTGGSFNGTACVTLHAEKGGTVFVGIMTVNSYHRDIQFIPESLHTQ